MIAGRATAVSGAVGRAVVWAATWRRRGATERAAARRRRERAERRTLALGILALATTGGLIATELGRVWRRGSAPLPADASEPADILRAADEAVRQTVEVAVAGYRAGTPRETALLNLLASFSLAFAITRASTHAIRRRGVFGPFRNLVVAERHIHHFVPGIVLAFAAGGVSIASRNEDLDRYLAVPFGVGMAMTLDESALLLKLDDVYWTEDGIVSVQITLATLLMISALALVLRALRRGEEQVLGADGSGAGVSGNGAIVMAGNGGAPAGGRP